MQRSKQHSGLQVQLTQKIHTVHLIVHILEPLSKNFKKITVTTQMCNLLCTCPTIAISDKEQLESAIVRKENNHLPTVKQFCFSS